MCKYRKRSSFFKEALMRHYNSTKAAFPFWIWINCTSLISKWFSFMVDVICQGDCLSPASHLGQRRAKRNGKACYLWIPLSMFYTWASEEQNHHMKLFLPPPPKKATTRTYCSNLPFPNLGPWTK